MNLLRLTAMFACFIFMMGCGSGKRDTQNATTPGATGTGTVYDNDNRTGDEADREMQVRDMMVDEDPVAYESDLLATEDVDTRNLDPDLDWDPIFFDFDKSNLSDAARTKLEGYADILLTNPNLKVLIEGHCDTRGTEEYNMALGERRAQSVKRYLLGLGVAEVRLRTISYGEIQPMDPGENEGAWAKNRRVAFTF